ncbi:N-6 DNA methylase [Helicobacter cetorum]
MCVKMLNPNEQESMIDTASGSCGFPIHTIFFVWKKILEAKGIEQSHLFTAEKKPIECEDFVKEKVFAIDFDEKAVRVSRALNLIAGDGQTNVLHLNTLDYERWSENYHNPTWIDAYNDGWKNIRKFLKNQKSEIIKDKSVYDCRDFSFDILMANPPFAGDIKESRILAKYELSLKSNNKGKVTNASKMGRDILFIERNLSFLKAGGRMAIVLPQGRFNNSSDRALRDFISKHARILAVIGLHQNVFKPHTGTKTSVLFLQKWHETLCPYKEDYNIFFATMQEPSKDNSGDKIYETFPCVHYFKDNKTHKYHLNDFLKEFQSVENAPCFYQKSKNEETTCISIEEYNALSTEDKKPYLKKQAIFNPVEPLLDTHGHLIVKHDLFNHDGLTKDGIAEAFLAFAKNEGLSFAPKQQPLKSLNDFLGGNLEISVLNLSAVLKDNNSFRFDSEYFKREYLENLKKLLSTPHTILNHHISHMSGGATPLGANYHKQGIPFLRVQNIMENYFSLTDIVYIDTEQENELKRSRLKHKDVLFTITGSYGKSAVVPLELENANINQHSVKITLKESLNPYFLATFLNSKFGKLQTDKNIIGVTRPALDYSVIKKFIIPTFSSLFETKIQDLVKQSEVFNQQSKNAYKLALDLLLKELDCKDFKPSENNISIKSFKESFRSSGRLDAEYYLEKYEQYEKLVYSYCNGAKILSEICDYKDPTDTPKKGVSYKYIELSNIGNCGDILGHTLDLGENLPSRAKIQVDTNEVIVSSIEGSLSSCALITPSYNKAFCSNGFHVIKSSVINSETLLVLFKSVLFQNLLRQNCSGTILTAISKENFKNLPIPLIDKNTQQQIATHVAKSFTLKEKAQNSLDLAKRSVEIAIERSEQHALEFLRKSLED